MVFAVCDTLFLFSLSVRLGPYGNQTVTYAHVITRPKPKSAAPSLQQLFRCAVPTPSLFLTAVTIRFVVMFKLCSSLTTWSTFHLIVHCCIIDFECILLHYSWAKVWVQWIHLQGKESNWLVTEIRIIVMDIFKMIFYSIFVSSVGLGGWPVDRPFTSMWVFQL